MNLLRSLTNALGFGSKKDPEPETLQQPVDEALSLEAPEGMPLPEKWVGKRGTQKLTEEQKLILVDMIAQGLTGTQIIQKMKDLGVTISQSIPYQYERTLKWKDVIRDRRKFYRDNLEEIDASHKAFRIRRMDHVQEMAARKGDLRVVVAANEQIRKEFEKDGSDINIFHNNPVYQQFNQMSTEELLRKQKEATAKLKLKKEN